MLRYADASEWVEKPGSTPLKGSAIATVPGGRWVLVWRTLPNGDQVAELTPVQNKAD